MSSFAERISGYADVSYPQPATETVIDEPAEDEITLSSSWTNLKNSFGGLRERFKTAQSEVKAIGHLAVLDVKAAADTLENSQTPETQPAKPYQLSFRERVWEQVKIEEQQKKYERRNRVRAIKEKAPWYAGALAISLATSYLSTKR